MHIQQMKFKCGDCFKPTVRRLANFQAKDDYECYAESYVKCFWGLCDHQKSTHEFVKPKINEVLTTQPLPQVFVTPATIKM